MSLHVRAKDWLIEPVVGHYTRVGSERGTLIQVAADNAGNPAHVLGDFRFRFPSSIPDGKYRLTIHWQTGRMNGTPWAFLLGTEAGSVREHQIPLADGGTISIRAIPDHHSDQWCTNDLAGPDPIDFSRWPNSPVAAFITISDAGSEDFFLRLRDMSPASNNSICIESISLIPVEAPVKERDSPAILCSPLGTDLLTPAGENFTIGVYYAMLWLEPQDNFSWDCAFMDMARSGCNFVVISGNCWADQWAAIKHWDMKGVTSYGQLNGHPGALVSGNHPISSGESKSSEND